MKYSMELEGYASYYVSSLPLVPNPRMTDDAGNGYGENIYWSWYSQKSKDFSP